VFASCSDQTRGNQRFDRTQRAIGRLSGISQAEVERNVRTEMLPPSVAAAERMLRVARRASARSPGRWTMALTASRFLSVTVASACSRVMFFSRCAAARGGQLGIASRRRVTASSPRCRFSCSSCFSQHAPLIHWLLTPRSTVRRRSTRHRFAPITLPSRVSRRLSAAAVLRAWLRCAPAPPAPAWSIAASGNAPARKQPAATVASQSSIRDRMATLFARALATKFSLVLTA
jgi:hypothetical protein